MAFRLDYFIPNNILRKSREVNPPGFTSMTKIFSRILNLLHVPHYDSCCPARGDSRPLRFNPSTGKIEYYNITNGTWMATDTYVVPTTTTTTTAAPTTTTTTTASPSTTTTTSHV